MLAEAVVSGAPREGERRLYRLYDRSGFQGFYQAILNAQVAHDALEFFPFQRRVVQCRGDDYARSRETVAQIFQPFRSLIIGSLLAGDDEFRRRGLSVGLCRLQGGAVSNKVFYAG